MYNEQNQINPMNHSMYQQPIVQNNYINNYSFYPQMNIKNDFDSNTDIREKLKQAVQNSKVSNNESSFKHYDIQNSLNTKATPYTPSFTQSYNKSNLTSINNSAANISKFDFNLRNTNSFKMSGTGKEELLPEEFNKLTPNYNKNDFNSLFGGFSSLMNNLDRGSYVSTMESKKKFSTVSNDDWTTSMQKRIERMSINDSYTGDLMKNDFVDYVYNYRFSINDRDDLNNLNYEMNPRMSNRHDSYNFSPSIVGIRPDPIDNNKDVKLSELKEDENEISKSEEENDNNNENSGDEMEDKEPNIDYNNYYNSIINNKKQ